MLFQPFCCPRYVVLVFSSSLQVELALSFSHRARVATSLYGFGRALSPAYTSQINCAPHERVESPGS